MRGTVSVLNVKLSGVSVMPWMSIRPLIDDFVHAVRERGEAEAQGMAVDHGDAGGVLAVDRSGPRRSPSVSRMLLLNVTVIVPAWKLISLPAAGLVDAT